MIRCKCSIYFNSSQINIDYGCINILNLINAYYNIIIIISNSNVGMK